MAVRNPLTGWFLVLAQALAGRLASHHYRSLPRLAGRPDGDYGRVSIVIPARNEADRLPALLESLAHLRYPDCEVVVVDDASSDGTGDVARNAGARVIRLSGPDPGWVGKSFACWTGAAATRGEWLLFTDADTVHSADSLGLAVRAAVDGNAGLVSLLARQHCRTFWERLLLPYAYALYFVGAAAINQPGGPAVANGQYMLFRRGDYQRIGGHAAVRGSVIEDISLARLAGRSGVRVMLLRGEEHLDVRMYQDLTTLWEGFGKNAFRFVTVSPRTGIPTALAGIAFLAAVPEVVRQRSALLRVALLLTPAASLAPWQQRFGVPLVFALLYPLAALVFQALALDSIRRSLTGGGTVWKGRRY